MEELQTTIHDEATRAQEQSLLAGLKECEKDLFDLLAIVNAGDLVTLPAFLAAHKELLTSHRKTDDLFTMKELSLFLFLTCYCYCYSYHC